ncbi:MAG: acyl carrier protein [Desulfobacteraceae bacterium]|nr:acyl carrier protein [Desulfobacteraceae bacterium]MCF8094570.1 acyl carrier protein [Desulfobacteraceae bacterium]
MTREELQTEICSIFRRQFDIHDPGPDDDLQDMHGFDSIDAIELLIELEKVLDVSLSQETKKDAMLHIRTVNQICDYVQELMPRQQAPNQDALHQ